MVDTSLFTLMEEDITSTDDKVTTWGPPMVGTTGQKYYYMLGYAKTGQKNYLMPG